VQSINSNYGVPKEDEIVHRLPKNVEILKLDSKLAKEALEEATSKHAFC